MNFVGVKNAPGLSTNLNKPHPKPRARLVPLWWVKLRNWEYWSMYVFYIPLIPYWLYLSLRARSFLFFTAANPGITGGGFVGESKIDLLKRLPAHQVPSTRTVKPGLSPAELETLVESWKLNYPVIVKPDVGERGLGVVKIAGEAGLLGHCVQASRMLLVQDFVKGPLEAGVFYYRLPGTTKGVVSSVVLKGFLSVVGDGVSTLQELILAQDRARFQLAALRQAFAQQWEQVLATGEKLELVEIGNHCRGTAFLNGNHLIDEQLTNSFDAVAQQVPGFYVGRFDVRAASAEALAEGKFQILELNGVAAEPGHIYEAGASIWQAYRTLAQHWEVVYKIARHNHRLGTPYVGLWQGIQDVWAYLQYHSVS